MEFRGIMGGFYRISEWIMRLSVINLLWVICSIPVFFILLNMFIVIQTPEFQMGALVLPFLIIAVLSPFTLFPATAAMFAVARKWVTGEEDVPLLKTYFRSYKENYLQSMIGGFVFSLIFVIIYVNYRFYVGQGGTFQLLSVLFIVFSFVMLAAVLNFFSITVHLHMKIFQIVKNSILITIGNPFNSLTLIICNGIILYISLFKFTFLIPFFMGSLIATFSFWQFNRSFQKLQLKQQKLAEKEAEKEAQREAGTSDSEASNHDAAAPDETQSKIDLNK